MPDLSIEQKYSNYVIAGVDEVGRGAWAGPVVAGAVIVRNSIIKGINDSKKLSKKKRQELNNAIWQEYNCSIGVASVKEINDNGINQATFIAIDRALEKLSDKATMAFIDGNYNKKFIIPSVNILKGDSKSLSIAAASIIAKVYRDHIMANLSEKFSPYKWGKNVGYGTKHHLEMLLEYGCSPHHRINYKPIAKILQKNLPSHS